MVLALAAVALLYFAAVLRERLRSVASSGSALPGFAFAGGVAAAGGFLAAAGLHFALADYADDIRPAAAQALNAIDSDFFLPFTAGIAALVLAISLLAIRTRVIARWLGWLGVVLFIVFWTPVGFAAFGLSGIWIIVVSVLLSLRGEPAAVEPPGAEAARPAA